MFCFLCLLQLPCSLPALVFTFSDELPCFFFYLQQSEHSSSGNCSSHHFPVGNLTVDPEYMLKLTSLACTQNRDLVALSVIFLLSTFVSWLLVTSSLWFADLYLLLFVYTFLPGSSRLCLLFSLRLVPEGFP